MNQYPFAAAMLLPLLYVLSLAPARAAQTGGIELQCQLYRISGTLTPDAGTPDRLTDEAGAPLPEIKPGLNMLVNARFKLAGKRLEINPGHWKWDGKEFALDGKSSATLNKAPLQQITAATVKIRSGEPCGISALNAAPTLYLERGPGRGYEVKRAMSSVGLSIDMTPLAINPGEIVLSEFKITQSAVDRREPSETLLPVGRPLLQHVSYGADLHLMPGLEYAILLDAGERSREMVLLRIKATFTRVEAPAEKVIPLIPANPAKPPAIKPAQPAPQAAPAPQIRPGRPMYPRPRRSSARPA